MPKPKNPEFIKVKNSSEEYRPSRIFCVGANYRKHVAEMGLPGREKPFFFMKPRESLVQGKENEELAIEYPDNCKNLEHELELVLLIGNSGSNIADEQAMRYVYGVGVGLDMTRRDLQKISREKKQPWEISKAFEQSAPIGNFKKISELGKDSCFDMSLTVNGVIRQRGNTGEMIFSMQEIISNLSKYFYLVPGDLIFTGTPQGVAAVSKGDKLVAVIDQLPSLCVNVV